MLFYPCFRDISPFGGTSLFLRTPAFKLCHVSWVQTCFFVPLPLSFFSSRGYKLVSFVPLHPSYFSIQGYKLVSSYPCFQAFSLLGGSSILSNSSLSRCRFAFRFATCSCRAGKPFSSPPPICGDGLRLNKMLPHVHALIPDLLVELITTARHDFRAKWP